jgi:ABC-2 type transport system permease protein
VIGLYLAHARGFFRDPAGLMLTLALPPFVYLMFAAIFGAAAGGELDLRIAVHDSVNAPASVAMIERLGERHDGRLRPLSSRDDVDRTVLVGEADVGVILTACPVAPICAEVVAHPGRATAGQALQGELLALSGATPPSGASPVRFRAVGPRGDPLALYFAGGVSLMFVFFAAMHGALGWLDDRRNGLLARLSLAAGGLGHVLAARAAWMITVGVAQTTLVFALAVRHAPTPDMTTLAAWTVTTLVVAAAAAGLALGLIALCRTRDQAEPVSTVAALLAAAMGGSMAPRFLMPEAFRTLGWVTPHAWGIDAYTAVVWQSAVGPAVYRAWAALALFAAAGFVLAAVMERRRQNG